MNDMQKDEHELEKAVRIRKERRDLWMREGERSIALNLAMIGALGWTIVIPSLGGLFLGRWLDQAFSSGVFWTLGLLVLGLTLGCWLAWKRMYRE